MTDIAIRRLAGDEMLDAMYSGRALLAAGRADGQSFSTLNPFRS